jgi:murein DD-endopeptidase MepM/ murein hydrolase activator NlpD
MKFLKRILLFILLMLIIGLVLPHPFVMPVAGAGKSSYNQQSFWAYPWGSSITHKGVDIFAKEGTTVKAPAYGLVVYTGNISKGGNVVLIVSAKWRIHYFAHLQSINTSAGSFVNTNETIGTVGTTGNAKGKAPHLHYTITSIIPMPWKADKSVQGWKKMFYINPIPLLNKASS